MQAGSSLVDTLVPTSTIADYGAAALSGALAATGIGFISSVAANAAISGTTYLLNCDIKGDTATLLDFTLATISGGLSGAIGGKGANGANLRGVYKHSKQVLETAVSPKKIAMYTEKLIKVKKDAVASVFSTIGSSIASNTFNGFRRRITGSIA